MHGANIAGNKVAPENFEYGYVDDAAIVAGSPLAKDVTATSGATAVDGATITDEQAVAAFVAKPSAANARLFAGLALQAAATGIQTKFLQFGAGTVRVRNTNSGQSVSLAVGDLLVQVPGQDYFTPVYQAVAAGGSVGISNHALLARAIVLKARTITASTTVADVRAYVFPPVPPRGETLRYTLAGANTTNLTLPLGFARGHGIIVRAGFGLEVCGTAGDAELDVLINGVSIFTTKPKIANDGTDPADTLKLTAAATVGTGGSFGTVNAAANILAPNDKISATVTYANSPSGQSGLVVQVETLYV